MIAGTTVSISVVFIFSKNGLLTNAIIAGMSKANAPFFNIPMKSLGEGKPGIAPSNEPLILLPKPVIAFIVALPVCLVNFAAAFPHFSSYIFYMH